MNDALKQNEVLEDQERERANTWLVEFMQSTLEDSKNEVNRLQRHLRWTYRIIIGISIAMFLVGIGLIVSSSVNAWTHPGKETQAFIIGGLGIADLVGLFVFRPIEQIRKIMADMSQITVAINSHQTQVSLRLLETDAKDRATMGEAAELIQKAARDSLKNIQLYFEDSDITKKRDNVTRSANEQNRQP